VSVMLPENVQTFTKVQHATGKAKLNKSTLTIPAYSSVLLKK
jgi:alpha-amylase